MANYKQSPPSSEKGIKLDIPLDDFIVEDDPSRVIQQIVWSLDTSKIESTYSEIGQRAHHPKMLLSVIFYGYTQGIRSGRKLSLACSTDVRFIWLSHGSRPKKTVLNDFRSKHYQFFEDLFKQVVNQAIDQGFIDLSQPMFGDGSKIRACANARHSFTQEQYKKWLVNLEQDIDELSESQTKEEDAGAQVIKKKALSKSSHSANPRPL